MRATSRLGSAPTIGINRSTLRFSDLALDRDFKDTDNRAAVGRARFMSLLALALSIPFRFVDVLLDPAHSGTLLRVRAIGTVALITVAALCTWWKSVHHHIQLISCGALAVYALSATSSVLLADVPRDYASVGSVLLMLGLVGVVRVRFRPALLTAVVVFPPVAVVTYLRQPSWEEYAFESISLLTYAVLIVTVSYVLERSKRIEFLANRDLADQRQVSDELLHNILPAEIAARLRENPTSIADAVDDASVLFADLVGFTPFSSSLPPAEVVGLLDLLFGKFDDLCEDRGIEKIKTIGDAYMAVAGIPKPDADHAASIVELAFDMQRSAAAISPLWPGELALRIGISSGPVVAGVIGHKKFAYDLWGDTVNTASRMESHGEPNRIQVSASTYELLRDRYVFSEPLVTDIKGKGHLTTYYLLGPEFY